MAINHFDREAILKGDQFRRQLRLAHAEELQGELLREASFPDPQ
jgi:hypothetical protein